MPMPWTYRHASREWRDAMGRTGALWLDALDNPEAAETDSS